MTEREKAAQGVLYDANYDESLAKEREICKLKCQKYNRLSYDDYEGRKALIREIVAECKGRFFIEQPFICDYGYNISLGDGFYSNHNLIILDAAKVEIGDNVFIAPDCGIYTAGHPLDVGDRNKGLEYAFSRKIGNNVWIGGHVSIMPGVTIGDGSSHRGRQRRHQRHSRGGAGGRKSLAASFARSLPRIKTNTGASERGRAKQRLRAPPFSDPPGLFNGRPGGIFLMRGKKNDVAHIPFKIPIDLI